MLQGEVNTDDIGKLIGYVQELIKLSSSIPKAIDVLNDLEEKVKKEQTGESRIRGGGEKGMFED
jgi:hypothetical protein